MKNIRKNYKKLLVATPFACFACNGLQAMLGKRKENTTNDNHENKAVKEESFNILDLNNDELNLIILETLNQNINPGKLAATCKRFRKITQNIILRSAKDKIYNNDPNFDLWFNSLGRYEKNLIKKILDLIANDYVNGYEFINDSEDVITVLPKTEEELNLLPDTIFKRIFINKWFWLKNDQQRFLNNTLPVKINKQSFNQRINNIVKNGKLNLDFMGITDEVLELILEIIIENGLTNQIIHLDLYDNQLTTIPESLVKLTQLEYLNLGSNQLTTIPESFGNRNQLTMLNLSYNKLTTETKEWLKNKYGNIKGYYGKPGLKMVTF